MLRTYLNNKKANRMAHGLKSALLGMESSSSSNIAFMFESEGLEDGLVLDEMTAQGDDLGAEEYTEELKENFDDDKIDDIKANTPVMEIMTHYVNQYRLAIEELNKRGDNIIDYTGDFGNSAIYKEKLLPIHNQLGLIYKDTPELKTLDSLLELILNKVTMNKVAGTVKEPFVYEGLQLFYINLINILAQVFPIALEKDSTCHETIGVLNLKVAKVLMEMIDDIVACKNIFGDKITFEPSTPDEMTGVVVDVMDTPYSDNPMINTHQMTSPIVTEESIYYRPVKRRGVIRTNIRMAGESILNLLEIKNNGALPEFTIVMKTLSVGARLSLGIDLLGTINQSTEMLESILRETNPESVITLVKKEAEKARGVLVEYQETFAKLLAEENDVKLRDDGAIEPKDLEGVKVVQSTKFTPGVDNDVEDTELENEEIPEKDIDEPTLDDEDDNLIKEERFEYDENDDEYMSSL